MIVLFAFTGIQTDIRTEFLPNPNRNANHYATEHIYFIDLWCFDILLKHTPIPFITSVLLNIW